MLVLRIKFSLSPIQSRDSRVGDNLEKAAQGGPFWASSDARDCRIGCFEALRTGLGLLARLIAVGTAIARSGAPRVDIARIGGVRQA